MVRVTAVAQRGAVMMSWQLSGEAGPPASGPSPRAAQTRRLQASRGCNVELARVCIGRPRTPPQWQTHPTDTSCRGGAQRARVPAHGCSPMEIRHHFCSLVGEGGDGREPEARAVNIVNDPKTRHTFRGSARMDASITVSS